MKSGLAQFNDWLDDGRSWWLGPEVGEEVVAAAKDQPLTLFTLRRGAVSELSGSYSVTSPAGLADAIVVWIDQDSGE